MRKILSILAALAAGVALFFRGQAHKERAEHQEEKVKRTQAAKDQSDKSTEALVEGLSNESKPIIRNGRRIK